MLAIGAGLLGAAAAHGEGAGATAKVREGGIFRVSGLGSSVDPAFGGDDAVLDATCAHLMHYPDLPPPHGLRLERELATGFPRVSNAGKTYTFTLRRGFRFSDKRAVGPRAFAWAIARGLAAGGNPWLNDIVGAKGVPRGTPRIPVGVRIQGKTRLIIRLRRAIPDFPARTTLPAF